MTIEQRIDLLNEEICSLAKRHGRGPGEVSFIAVTKGFPLEHVIPAYNAGIRRFGENRIQEAAAKMENAPNDIEWHLIGTLQKNKVRKALENFSLIHSVDSLDLAKKISQTSLESGSAAPILLQVNISGETAKHGFSKSEVERQFESLLRLTGIEIQGLMTIAPFIEDQKLIRQSFSGLRLLRDELQKRAGNACYLKHLSMGMSHDYRLAVAEGATLLRIGTAIFGSGK